MHVHDPQLLAACHAAHDRDTGRARLASGLVELARVPEVAADALRLGSGESAGDLALLLRLRNALLAAVAVLLDALHGEMPAATQRFASLPRAMSVASTFGNMIIDSRMYASNLSNSPSR